MEIKIISIDDKTYPNRLRKIENPPKILYAIGNERLLNNECLSIVGSRNCTERGAQIARNFARQLAQKRSYNCKWNGCWYR